MVLTWLDINPNNILLSDIESASQMVKLGDLGYRVRLGETLFTSLSNDPSNSGRFQHTSYTPNWMQGAGGLARLGLLAGFCIWSLGVTVSYQTLYPRTQLIGQLAHWPGHQSIFGDVDKVAEDHTASWCIAKIDRLVGPLGPPVQKPVYGSESCMAGEMSTDTYIDPGIDRPVPYVHVATLRQELESLPDPELDLDILDLIDSLLTVGRKKGPTAAEALKYPYLRTIKV